MSKKILIKCNDDEELQKIWNASDSSCKDFATRAKWVAKQEKMLRDEVAANKKDIWVRTTKRLIELKLLKEEQMEHNHTLERTDDGYFLLDDDPEEGMPKFLKEIISK